MVVLENKTADVIKNAVLDIMNEIGQIEEIMTDNNREFVNETFAKMCDEKKIAMQELVLNLIIQMVVWKELLEH